jgi:hypothetical protein
MNKRELCEQRRTVRKIVTGLALVSALAIETLMVAAVARDVLRPTLSQTISVDMGACFAGR